MFETALGADFAEPYLTEFLVYLYEIFSLDAPDYGLKVCQVSYGYLENWRNDKERNMAHRTKMKRSGWPKFYKVPRQKFVSERLHIYTFQTERNRLVYATKCIFFVDLY